ncbi:hypothetical protein [Curtobacterium sp. MCBD17_021]|uniref:hypothetical protein n=1 Tax=Curtobacterium sp. MCBD17_021 TaxID=2175665 RepID=UPI000DA7FC6E|nr:hypothetical protein [Curtobacterium sp. MCBD17_021]PZE66929.1 hypothetical protein DEI83_06365 [Curtobacterium sp. MCBD17_021]
MSSVEPGDWMVSKANPSAFLEVVAVSTENGQELVDVRIGQTVMQVSKRYLLATWSHLEDER